MAIKNCEIDALVARNGELEAALGRRGCPVPVLGGVMPPQRRASRPTRSSPLRNENGRQSRQCCCLRHKTTYR